MFNTYCNQCELVGVVTDILKEMSRVTWLGEFKKFNEMMAVESIENQDKV